MKARRRQMLDLCTCTCSAHALNLGYKGKWSIRIVRTLSTCCTLKIFFLNRPKSAMKKLCMLNANCDLSSFAREGWTKRRGSTAIASHRMLEYCRNQGAQASQRVHDSTCSKHVADTGPTFALCSHKSAL